MRFDATLFYRVGDPYPWETLFDEMHRTVELADELGFTGLWLAERHFAWDGWYRSGSNPLLLGADRARYSDRPRFGQCGLIAPDWHPIRLAEDIATFDRMTRGRVDIGVAPGIDSRACGNFHPTGDRRDPDLDRALYNENVEILLKALTREAWSHEGRFHTFPAPGWAEANPMAHDPRFHDENGEVVKLRIEPGPHRKPRPPMWSMASRWRRPNGTRGWGSAPCASTSRWAASGRTGKPTPPPARPMAGSSPSARTSPSCARSISRRPTRRRSGPRVERLTGWASGNVYRMREVLALDEELDDGDMALGAFDFNMKHDLIIVGSPETAVRKIERPRDELGRRHIALFLNAPGLGFDRVQAGLRLFAERAMPRFAD